MADQPTKTLREAVEIVAQGHPYPHGYQFLIGQDLSRKEEDQILSKAKDRTANYTHARAIVDAAVEAHEAKVECDRRWQNRDSTHEGIVEAAEASHAAEARLLALERGEDA